MSTARRIAQLEAKRARTRKPRVFIYVSWPGKDTAGDEADIARAQAEATREGRRLTVIHLIDPNIAPEENGKA